MTKTTPKRTKPQTFDTPQTWFKIDPHSGTITPLPGVIRATRTQATVQYINNYPSAYSETKTCTYYRSEVFPTYSEAVNALVETTDQLRKDAEAQVAQAKAKLDEADQTFRQAVRTFQNHHNTPNPDAIIGTHGWVYFVTQAALNTAPTIQPLEGDKLTEDSYRTIKPENAQHFANELRKLGLTVAE